MKHLLILVALGVVGVAIANPIQDVDLCTDCTNLFTDVKTRLAAPTTSAAIEAGVNKYVCNLFLFGKEACEGFVKTAVTTVLGMVANMVDANSICTMMMYCQPTPPPPEYHAHLLESMSLAKDVMNLISREGDELLCTDCTNLFTDVKDRLANEQTTAILVSQIEKYTCNIVPIDSVKGVCNSFVSTLVGSVLSGLANMVDPPMVCGLLGYCTPPAPPPSLEDIFHKDHVDLINRFLKMASKPRDDVDLCTDCTNLFTDVKTRLTNPQTASALISQVTKYSCDILPFGNTMCTGMVTSVITNLLTGVAGLVEPTGICTMLMYCQAPQPPPLRYQSRY